MKVNANANANRADRNERANHANRVKRAKKAHRGKKAHRANKHDKANRANRHDKAHRGKKAHKGHRADKTQKVRINAQELFKTMSVSPSKIFGQDTGTTGNGFATPPKPTDNENAGGMGQVTSPVLIVGQDDDDDKVIMGQGNGIGQANGNKPATPPGATMKLAAKLDAQNKALRTPPGQAIKELKNADNGSKSGKPDFVNQLTKTIDELVTNYKNIMKFQAGGQKSEIFKLSNRLETISSLFGKSKETDSIRPLANFVNSNLGITRAINQGGGVRINFNPVTSAYKAAQNGYKSQEAGVNKLVV
ncbi:MAG: hypothetical protein ACYSR0_08150 [Planctomycetota bacterium]|jgi:hypothetical protein